MAGIFSTISYFYNKSGNDSKIYYHKKDNVGSVIASSYDSIGITKFSLLLLKTILQARHYDIIHISSVEYLVPIFRFLGKRVVLSYHGSDILDGSRSSSFSRKLCRSMANVITFNRQDMLPKIKTVISRKKVFLPTIVDTEMFHSLNGHRKGWVSFVSTNLDSNTTEEILTFNSNTRIVNLENEKIEYKKLNEFFNQFEGYVDIKVKYGGIIQALSMTGLQALASGCKVYNCKKTLLQIPIENLPDSVLSRLDYVYGLATKNFYKELSSEICEDFKKLIISKKCNICRKKINVHKIPNIIYFGNGNYFCKTCFINMIKS